jgi:SAM-dependent methyltransferase
MKLFATTTESVKHSIRNKLAVLPEVTHYVPYQPTREDYIIPKDDSDTDGQCELGLPVPPPALRQDYGGGSKEGWLRSGKENLEQMLTDLRRTGFEITPGKRILDFGCQVGRVIRHLQPFSEQSEIWGVDIMAAAIFWAKRHLGRHFRFAVVRRDGHLPFDDRYFDLIFAGSVFTHIDDMTDMWLLELRRILRPGGRLYITIHDNRSIDLLLNGQFTEGKLGRQLRDFYDRNPSLNGGFRMFTIGREPRSQVFWDRECFREEVGRFFEVREIVEIERAYQTAVVLERPTAS